MFVDNIWLDLVLRGALLAIISMGWVVLLIRLNGLRSLSKMTNFDFVMTVGLGSLIASASQSTEWQSFLQSLAGIAGLFLAQWGAARLRRSSETVENLIENSPTLLMHNGRFLEDAMKRTRVDRDDILSKLRGANVHSIEEVRAVVLETTGDISVMHGEYVDETLLDKVRRVD